MLRAPARGGIGLAAVLLLVVGCAVTAFAYWSTSGSGSSVASAGTLAAPTGVTATSPPSSSTVTVGFTGTMAPAGTLTGYYVTRYVGAVPSPACGTNPASAPTYLAAAATGCVDSAVPNGTYTYRVTAVFRTWTAQSATSAPVTVSVETTPPTQVLAVAGAATYVTGSTVYFGSAASGSLTVSAAVTDSGSGPASAAFPALTAAGWTHAAEVVTTGVGAPPTRTYASSPFSWAAGAANPPAYTVTGADVAGNQVTSTLTLVGDASAPTGGALTVNGAAGTSSGALGYDVNGTFTGTRTNFTADTGSGLLSSVLTREVGALLNGGCTAYGAPTTVAGNPTETAQPDGCYRYTLTGTDRVGNSAVRTTEIRVDSTTPAQTFSATGNGAVTGTTLYYRRGTAGSFVLTSTVADTESGALQAAFPAMPAGWTHPAQTVTTGAGSDPSVAYASTYSWTANPNNPNGAARTVTASDRAGNTNAVQLTMTADNAAPTGGALTVNGTGAVVGGTISYSGGTFTGTRTDFADTGSGIGTGSVLERTSAALVNGVCGVFGAPVTVVGAPDETALPAGCYRYALSGTDRVGNVANPLVTTVVVDSAAPTQTVTMGGGAGVATLTGTTVYYRAGVAGSFTLTSTLTDAESGPSQVVFPAIATTGWTHNNQTVTPGTGAAPTRTYTSTTFSWTANPSVPAAYTITGSDVRGNTVTTVLTFVADTTGPTGGALTVNGTAGASGTAAPSWSSSGTYTGTFAHFNADAGAGFAASVLTRTYTATLANGVCGAYGAAATITSISETNAAAGCYRYVLTGTDDFGNSSVLSVEVEVDKTVPTQVLSATGNAYVSGATLYWRSGAPGSFVLTSTVTDAQSGPGQALFPALAASGWTPHAAEPVTSGTGAAPTTAYSSSAYAWGASPATPSAAERTVVGSDLAGNDDTDVLTFTADNTAPTGGALTVNGTAASGGGTTSSTNASSWTIGTRTDYNADTGSGFASSVLTREAATWDGATCGTFGAPVTIVGAAAQTGMAGSTCYRYVLTGTDNVGNLSTLTTTVRTGLVVSSVTLVNGPNTAGTLNQGDTINVTFSGPVDVSSICSTWSGDSTDQSVTGNNVVGVTIHGGTGTANDYMEVTTSGAACGGSFNFGSLLLGDDGYLVSTTIQTFRGTAGNQSTIAYDASTYTLTITLGRNETTPGVDGSNNVNGNTVAVYTPSAAIQSSGGLGITGTGSTANVRQF